MKLKIAAVGKIKEKFFTEAIDEYVKRLGRFCSVEIVEVDERTFKGIPNESEIRKIVQDEGERLLRCVEGCLVALDIAGTPVSSVEIAEKLEKLTQRYSTVTFVVGGSYGLSEELKQRADFRLSFGKITLPHQLCRVVLCEQLYRAFTIKNNVPYHK